MARTVALQVTANGKPRSSTVQPRLLLVYCLRAPAQAVAR